MIGVTGHVSAIVRRHAVAAWIVIDGEGACTIIQVDIILRSIVKIDRACALGGIVCPQYNIPGAVNQDDPAKRPAGGVAWINHIIR